MTLTENRPVFAAAHQKVLGENTECNTGYAEAFQVLSVMWSLNSKEDIFTYIWQEQNAQQVY